MLYFANSAEVASISIDPSTILAGVFALVTAIVVAKLREANERNLKLREALNSEKQKVYRDLLVFLDVLSDGGVSDDQAVASMKKHTSDLVFYASSGVLKSFGDVMQHVYSDGDDVVGEAKDYNNLRLLKLLAELKVEIRRDLGNAKAESWIDILRLTITDINSYMPKSYTKDRGRKTLPEMIIKDKKAR